MIYVGLDVHKRFSRMGCFNPATGEVHDLGSVSNEPSALQQVLEKLASPKTVVLEAGWSSYHMAGLLESMAEEVWAVDPGEVRRLQHTILQDRSPGCGGAGLAGSKGRTEATVATWCGDDESEGVDPWQDGTHAHVHAGADDDPHAAGSARS